MGDLEKKVREAGRIQSDPALAAIQDLDDSVKGSFQILEDENKKLKKDLEAAGQKLEGEIEKTRTEMAAGFKVHSDKINAADRRSIALGIGGAGRDVEGCCLAAMGETEKKDIGVLALTMSETMRKRTDMKLLANPVGAALSAHWMLASYKLQKRRYTNHAEEKALYESVAKYEKALADLFPHETAAAFDTNTTTLGGHWLPDPVAQDLYRLITDNSVLSSQATHVPMMTKTLDLPTEGSSSLTISWGAEASTITDSVPASNAVNKVILTAQRLQGFAASSIEELQDSAIAILSWVQAKLTELAGREIDRVFLEGTVSGAQLVVGLGTHASVPAIVAGTNGDALTYAMLVAQVFKARERASREGAKWFVSPEAMAKIVGLVDSQGMPIVQFGNVPNQFAASILGFPVEVHSAILANRTKGTSTTGSHLYFGPPKQLVVGDRMGMAWDVSDIPGFTTGMVNMRLIARVGLGIAVPGAFSRHEDVITL